MLFEQHTHIHTRSIWKVTLCTQDQQYLRVSHTKVTAEVMYLLFYIMIQWKDQWRKYERGGKETMGMVKKRWREERPNIMKWKSLKAFSDLLLHIMWSVFHWFLNIIGRSDQGATKVRISNWRVTSWIKHQWCCLICADPTHSQLIHKTKMDQTTFLGVLLVHSHTEKHFHLKSGTRCLKTHLSIKSISSRGF